MLHSLLSLQLLQLLSQLDHILLQLPTLVQHILLCQLPPEVPLLEELGMLHLLRALFRVVHPRSRLCLDPPIHLAIFAATHPLPASRTLYPPRQDIPSTYPPHPDDEPHLGEDEAFMDPSEGDASVRPPARPAPIPEPPAPAPHAAPPSHAPPTHPCHQTASGTIPPHASRSTSRTPTSTHTHRQRTLGEAVAPRLQREA
ncbi:hypothetical protein O6H91_10G092800 [Diphasiastrum complanatum]|uniref:Uncharacterized protein n=1 Tax=Diphasiastrum complanatum TaxID=34168 RepID=A0ACC2CJJ8_DIPCM|nr:hypothetical protein O6H91_10G092800 [Diphasiastrum complanatum]